jgi:hypothetical protein
MTAEFNVWLLIVGLVIGAGLTWLVVAEIRRSDDDVSSPERQLEARWISDQLAGSEDAVSDDQAAAVLRLHARYLAISLPPEDTYSDELGEAPLARDSLAPGDGSHTDTDGIGLEREAHTPSG